MCKNLDIKPRAYYSWVEGNSFQVEQQDKQKDLDSLVKESYDKFKQKHGSRYVYKDLIKQDFTITLYQVQQSMSKQGLYAKLHRKSTTTTKPGGNWSDRPDLVNRNFYPGVAGTVFCGDITYLKIPNGFCYMSTVIDLSTRQLVGYQVARRMTADIVVNALLRAKGNGYICGNAIFHSDRGSQYTSTLVQEFADASDIRLSVGRTGSCHDNAVAESFFSIMKREIGDTFNSFEDATAAIIKWIGYYNNRMHSTLNYETPNERFSNSLNAINVNVEDFKIAC
jgi:transposase InsO family protein